MRFADRVKQTTTSTGTGALMLDFPAPSGFVGFNAAFGTSSFYYAIQDGTSAWEVGIGHMEDTEDFRRDVMIASSDVNDFIDVDGPDTVVFATIPAYFANQLSSRGVATAIANRTFIS